MPSFFSNDIDFDLPKHVVDQSISSLDEFIILSYRFNSKVEISLNGRTFTCVSCDGDGSAFTAYNKLFSQVVSLSGTDVGMSPLTVGGVTPEHCGFDGLLAEVVIFEEPLLGAECQDVVVYLAEKYLISVSSGLLSSSNALGSFFIVRVSPFIVTY